MPGTPGLAQEDWARRTRSLRALARSIVGRDELAEEVVQGAWLRALERPPATFTWAWLQRVTRNRAVDVARTEGRRSGAPLNPDSALTGPDPAHIAEQFELQRRVLAAVEALDEPYRGVVYLRYFEDATPTAIAAGLDRPLKTVKTQLARGLQRLREALDDLRDEHGAWSPLLLGFARDTLVVPASPLPPATAPPGTSALHASLFAMKKLVLSVVVLALATATWIVVEGGAPAEAPPAEPGIVVPAPVEADRGPDLEVAELEADPRSRVATPPEAPAPPVAATDPSASLLVRMRWADGDPAEGVAAILSPMGADAMRLPLERQVTGADGSTRFERLSPGQFLLQVDRGSSELEEVVTLEADADETLELRLPAGLDVAGRVVDVGGAPIAGAAIWLTAPAPRWTAGRVVAHSDANGRFTLRDAPGSQSLAAMAPGYQQSRPVDLDLADRSTRPVEITLRLGPGGATLRGRVRTVSGEPAAGALVTVGENTGYRNYRANDSIAEEVTVRTARTDAEGLFTLDSLPSGEQRVRVRHGDAALWSEVVLLESLGVHELEVELQPGARVEGLVLGADGAPFPGAIVHAFEIPLDESFLSSGQIDYTGTFQHPVAVSGPDGRYALQRITPGTVYLYALSRAAGGTLADDVAFDRLELSVGPGETHSWDPVLEDGNVLEGEVAYRNGEPMTGVFVSAVPQGGGTRRTVYSQDGTFRFVRLDDAPHDVTVQVWDLPEGAQEPQLLGVQPGGERLRLVADFDPPGAFAKALVRVRFEDAAGRAPDPARVAVALEASRSSSWLSAGHEDDVYRFTVETAGAYVPLAHFDDRILAIGEPIEVASGEVHDVTLRTRPGGTLVVEVAREPEHTPEDWTLWLKAGSSRRSEQIPVGLEGELRLDSLQPGAGSLTLVGENVAKLTATFEVVAGEERRVTIRPRAAVPVPYVVHWSSEGEDPSLSIRVVDRETSEALVEVTTEDRTRFPRPVEWTIPIPLGSYRFEVVSGGGTPHVEEFEITSLDPTKVPRLVADVR